MNSLDKQYTDLLKDVIENGHKKGDRTGTGTLSVFGRTIRHDMSEGFPLLTTKKMAWKQIRTELLWFLRGDTNIRYLLKHKNYIWVGDAYKKYGTSYKYSSNPISFKDKNPANGPVDRKEFIRLCLEDDWFNSMHGNLGPVYGKQWMKWEVCGGLSHYPGGINQIQVAIDQLKNNPDSRRIMVSAWNVGDLQKMTLPPCHYGFQIWTRELTYIERYNIWFNSNYETGMERNYDNIPDFENDYYEPTPLRAISLIWNQRSADVFLGLPFNIASYGLLLEIIAKEVGMVPDELIGNLGDTHLYSNHMEQAKEQISRKPFDLPNLNINLHFKNDPSFVPENWLPEDFEIFNYESHPAIKAELSN